MENTMPMHHLLSDSKKEQHSSYKKLAILSVLHFIIMYLVMYTMVYSFKEVIPNINNFYMTGMMLSPMIILMPLAMSKMYPDKKLNLSIYFISSILFVLFFYGMRTQALVGDKQFVKSMIPHHSGAILMCEQANITDMELKNLCAKIIKGQSEEIQQMRAISERLR